MTPESPRHEGLCPELRDGFEQIERIREEAKALVEGLSEAQCAWQPAPDRWSIAQCLEHLNATARNYLPVIHASINDARAQGWLAEGPFRRGWFERFFLSMVEPPPRRRIPAPRRFLPPPDRPMAEIWPSFLTFQDRLQELMTWANGVDLRRARVVSPALRLLRFSLGGSFALMTAHERRHLWQIRRILEDPSFPRA